MNKKKNIFVPEFGFKNYLNVDKLKVDTVIINGYSLPFLYVSLTLANNVRF